MIEPEPVERTEFSRRGVATTADIRRLIDRVKERFDYISSQFVESRKDALTIVVVPELADLPAEAKPTEWFRVVATPAAVYVGNGPGRPLSKFQTTAL